MCNLSDSEMQEIIEEAISTPLSEQLAEADQVQDYVEIEEDEIEDEEDASQYDDMTEYEVSDLIANAIYMWLDEEDCDASISTYEQAGVLTNNEGLVVTINGKKFQVTVVRAS
ncbi:hypothetical protein ADN00_15630 [Ornatilinea apprima]|uniref:Uncharacterized protein n=1 Tax=Ornatilinea apprima TaxID=1134406 RepID=A0A0P6WQB0_9CHLR|nr:hypothetical protein [Ornatilinea apprima]KPL72246.1 hypothetical protein ADN00_15630 [Ornatilinea apprima]